MYKYVLVVIYKYFKKINDKDPLFAAACVVFVAQIAHAVLLISILNIVFKFNILRKQFSNNYMENKIYWTIVLLPWLLVVYQYYRSKVREIISEIDDVQGILTSKEFVLTFLIVLFPIILAFVLLHFNAKV